MGKSPESLLLAMALNTAISPRLMAIPSAVPITPRIPACQRKTSPVRPSAMPSALRMPICLVFCTAEMARVEAMPSMTAMITNTWIMYDEVL